MFCAPVETQEVARDWLTVRQDWRELSIATCVAPRCGDVLVFPHGNHPGCHPNPLPGGPPVISGEKLLIRTDLVHKASGACSDGHH